MKNVEPKDFRKRRLCFNHFEQINQARKKYKKTKLNKSDIQFVLSGSDCTRCESLQYGIMFLGEAEAQ